MSDWITVATLGSKYLTVGIFAGFSEAFFNTSFKVTAAWVTTTLNSEKNFFLNKEIYWEFYLGLLPFILWNICWICYTQIWDTSCINMDPWFQAFRYANWVSVTNKTLETMLLWFHRAFIAPHHYAKLIQISCVSRIQSQSSGLISEGMV